MTDTRTRLVENEPILATEPGHFPQSTPRPGGPRELRHERLIREHRGKIHQFRQLPPEAQLALAHYMGVEGVAWDFSGFVSFDGVENPHGREPAERERILENNSRRLVAAITEALPHIVDRYGDSEYGLVEAPTEELIRDIWESYPDIREEHADFAEYHAWYLQTAKGYRVWYGQPTWPCLLSGFPGETFHDGWHRFHAYVASGATMIPCLWYPGDGYTQWDK